MVSPWLVVDEECCLLVHRWLPDATRSCRLFLQIPSQHPVSVRDEKLNFQKYHTAKSLRTLLSPSPTHLLSILEAQICFRVFNICPMVWARSVFPVPGGPYRRRLLTIWRLVVLVKRPKSSIIGILRNKLLIIRFLRNFRELEGCHTLPVFWTTTILNWHVIWFIQSSIRTSRRAICASLWYRHLGGDVDTFCHNIKHVHEKYL